jgi:hypothetical protein
MPPVQAFYSRNELEKTAAKRVYHNNSACHAAHEIAPNQRRLGTNNYRQCRTCALMMRHGR